MALKVWLPLNGTLDNQGCSEVTATVSGATVNTSGKIGSCYSFDGSNDFISLSGNTLYNIFKGGSQQFSICFWVYHNDATRAIIFGDYGLSGSIGFNVELTASHGVRFYWNGSPDKNFNSTSYVTAQGWTHIVITYSGSILNIYRNGILSTDSWSGTLATKNKTTGQFYLGRDSRTGTTALNGRLNDFRIYDHCLSAAKVREISQGLILHYKLDGIDTPNENLGNTSADYHNFADGYSKAAGGWGGDAGTVTFHHSGGYAGLPYKELHKTATGTGGIYSKTADDIILESNTTYTMSCWIKSSRNFKPISYSFNINRGVGNVYITYGSSFDLTTEWQFFSKTFTTTEDQAGSYGEMSIIYDDDATDYYVYYSGFKIEKGTTATRWTPPGIQYTTIQDSSGYNHNGTITGTISIDSDSPRYQFSTYVNGSSYILTPAGSFAWNDLTQLTFSAWMKPTASMTGWRGSVGIAADALQTSRGIAITDYGNEFRGTYTNGSSYATIATGKTLTQNEWHHCAGTLNGTEFKLYFDGELVKTQTINWGTATLNTGARFEVGVDIPGSDEKFTGNYSDVRCYCTALNADDILQLYHTSAKVDNQQNLHTFELAEVNSGKELLAAVPLTSSYGNHTAIWSSYDENGEITLTGSSHLGSPYIKINPEGKKYYFDADISVEANNQVYIGFQRYDAAKTSRSNDATMYTINVKPTTNLVHQHYHGIYDATLSKPNFGWFDTSTPVDTISLRILNDWSSANNRKLIVHRISLREISTLDTTKINKQGQSITDNFVELDDNCHIQKNGSIESNEFIEF